METILKVLGDLNRLRIINLLLNMKLCVCEIEETLQLQQTSVSRHLAKLKSINILSSERKAQWIYYCVSQVFIEENEFLINYLKDMFNKKEIFQQDLFNYKDIKERCTAKKCCTKGL